MVDVADFGDLHLVDDVSSADWIVAGVRNFEYDVASLLPVTFEAYARVLHPASLSAGSGDTVDVAWSEVAAANGRIAHAAMEWVAITGDWKFEQHAVQPGVWDAPPSTGSLPPRNARSLADVLGRFTATPSECWFGVWEGYGGAPFQPGTVPLVAMPQRKMALLRGPLHAAGTAFSGMGWPESPSLWWPDDHSWCVATDIDLMSTYIGGSAPCVEAVLADERLEAFAVTVDQTVHWRSDTINPTPDPPPPTRGVKPHRSWRRPQPSPGILTSRGPRPAPPGDTPGR
ncbi:MAG: hypothetical protein WB808_12900 [Candidatus Dormiibacterota bacterium]